MHLNGIAEAGRGGGSALSFETITSKGSPVTDLQSFMGLHFQTSKGHSGIRKTAKLVRRGPAVAVHRFQSRDPCVGVTQFK